MDSVRLWILVGFLAWVVVALALAVVLGRMIRVADRAGSEEARDGATSPGAVPARVAALHAPV